MFSAGQQLSPRTAVEFDEFFARQLPTGFTSESVDGVKMTYGEILASGVEAMLARSAELLPDDAKFERGITFLDLGSGIGKGPILASRMCDAAASREQAQKNTAPSGSPSSSFPSFDFSAPLQSPRVHAARSIKMKLKMAIGIELSEQRHETGLLAIDRLAALLPADDGRVASGDGNAAKHGGGGAGDGKRSGGKNDHADMLRRQVRLIRGDVLTDSVPAIAASDVIWVSNMCFPRDITARLARLLDAFARPGALVFASRELHLVREVERLESPRIAQSWHGAHEVFLYRIGGGGARYGRQLHWPGEKAASAHYKSGKEYAKKRRRDLRKRVRLAAEENTDGAAGEEAGAGEAGADQSVAAVAELNYRLTPREDSRAGSKNSIARLSLGSARSSLGGKRSRRNSKSLDFVHDDFYLLKDSAFAKSSMPGEEPRSSALPSPHQESFTSSFLGRILFGLCVAKGEACGKKTKKEFVRARGEKDYHTAHRDIDSGDYPDHDSGCSDDSSRQVSDAEADDGVSAGGIRAEKETAMDALTRLVNDPTALSRWSFQPLEEDVQRQVYWNSSRSTASPSGKLSLEDSIVRAFCYWSLVDEIPDAGADSLYNQGAGAPSASATTGPHHYTLYPWGLPQVPPEHSPEFYALRLPVAYATGAACDALLAATEAECLLDVQVQLPCPDHPPLSFREFRNLVYKHKPRRLWGW